MLFMDEPYSHNFSTSYNGVRASSTLTLLFVLFFTPNLFARASAIGIPSDCFTRRGWIIAELRCRVKLGVQHAVHGVYTLRAKYRIRLCVRDFIKYGTVLFAVSSLHLSHFPIILHPLN